jgi:hypothetical protein
MTRAFGSAPSRHAPRTGVNGTISRRPEHRWPEECTHSDRGPDHRFPSGSVRLVRNPETVPIWLMGPSCDPEVRHGGQCRLTMFMKQVSREVDGLDFPSLDPEAEQVERLEERAGHAPRSEVLCPTAPPMVNPPFQRIALGATCRGRQGAGPLAFRAWKTHRDSLRSAAREAATSRKSRKAWNVSTPSAAITSSR